MEVRSFPAPPNLSLPTLPLPGITGIFAADPPGIATAAVECMVDSMRHERFYSSGQLLEPRLELAVGWVCHQGSYSDCMPAWNEAHDVCLIFWGEHFGDPSEVQTLKAAGHSCSDSGATNLVHLYEEHGSRFFEQLNGTFCGLVIDLREKKIVLFNDRYGLARLYYHESSSGFFFSSEAKALLKGHARNSGVWTPVVLVSSFPAAAHCRTEPFLKASPYYPQVRPGRLVRAGLSRKTAISGQTNGNSCRNSHQRTITSD